MAAIKFVVVLLVSTTLVLVSVLSSPLLLAILRLKARSLLLVLAIANRVPISVLEVLVVVVLEEVVLEDVVMSDVVEEVASFVVEEVL